ncbi:hypothetical protein P171DRAFT_69836 [Karstenula rhodostoma CBS 690.94]|uniref:Uncharacterized protein n=1 Tax=Karstenula rhodostoma CBS 690.94 TaxID=1392251 RepID=A0A9P4PEK6_9PLEO|nr:hypothetical protein P171DRAFT_69836 [Karstenula rhodostoma CBS 690.94]
MPFDPESLDYALANIAKRSSNKYYQTSSQSPTASAGAPHAPPSHVPGSWPSPPLPPSAALGLQLPSQVTHISWDQCVPELSRGWDEGNGWESEEEERESSIWDNGHTWGTTPEGNGPRAFRSERAHKQVPVAWNAPAPHAPSPATQTARTGQWTHSSNFQTAQSRPSASAWESELDGEGWTHVEASSDSSGSWSLPVHPSESISHVAGPSVVASATSQAPFLNGLSSKLLSLKKDEGKQRRYVATAPAVSSAPPTHFPGDGFSTFEKTVRGAPVNGRAASVWKVDSSQVAPRAWPALEEEIMSRDLASKPFSVDNGYGKDTTAFDNTVHDNKIGRGLPKGTSDNGWTTKDTVGSAVCRPFVRQENVHKPKDDWTAEKLRGNTVEDISWDNPCQPKNLQSSDTSWQADINGWSAPQKAKSMIDGRGPWTVTDEAKTRPSKTRLSKYRQLRSAVPVVATQGHRQLPLLAPESQSGIQPKNDDMEAEPLLKVSKEDATKKGVEHQVRAGKGSKYGHAIGRPEYLDSLEKPVSFYESSHLGCPKWQSR